MTQDPRLLLQKADKAAQGATGGFSLFGGRQEKWENAADLYSQAANAFRVQKQSTLFFIAFGRPLTDCTQMSKQVKPSKKLPM